MSCFDNIGHVRGHLNSWISDYIQYYEAKQLVLWDHKFVDCPTHEIHEIKIFY